RQGEGSHSQLPTRVSHLARIQSASTKMNDLINELLDFARLQMGQSLDLYRRSTDLVALCRQVVAEHQQSNDRHIMRVEADVPELVGMWDTPRLQRVLDNLLSNAIKYSPKGGQITVEVSLEGDGDQVL